MGYPQIIHFYFRIFHYKPSSYWGTPFMDTSISILCYILRNQTLNLNNVIRASTQRFRQHGRGRGCPVHPPGLVALRAESQPFCGLHPWLSHVGGTWMGRP